MKTLYRIIICLVLVFCLVTPTVFAFDNDLETIRLTCKIAERWTKNKKRKVEVPIWFASHASLNERKEVFIEVTIGFELIESII